ncbi:MAG: helix-turn-helix transcriptional regulator [Rhodocyclaceae bacterium]|nr:helix-turn-helix transcriptional regulator [Rhodocyclaceae bacterium]
MSDAADRPHLTARQAAAYLQINEKKLYELANAREVPAARVGGKWLFPRVLLDQWLMEQAHGGLFADRLLVGGAADPILEAAVLALSDALGDDALVGCLAGNSAAGLAQLSARRLDACAFHWGPAEASARQQSALLVRQRHHEEWTCVRLAWRDVGVMLRPGLDVADLQTLLAYDYRWVLQPPGSGSRYGLQLAVEAAGFRLEDCGEPLAVRSTRSAATALARGLADCSPGPRGTAAEHGLGFVPLGVESLDLALPRAVFFRQLFQHLLETVASAPILRVAGALGGYDLSPLGRVLPITP